ncbi:MAG: XdhC family protein, partial [Chitinophagaceae bacterium]
KQVHDKSAAINQSGMICSGEQTVWLYPVKIEEAAAIGQLIHSLEENKNGTLVLSPGGLVFEETIPEKDFDLRFESEVNWQYKEKTGYKNKLFIIGGGHCSLALSRLMQPMDFYISVYDDRKDLKTLLENDPAHEKHIVDDYSALKRLIPSSANHYVVIMTFGYRTDDLAIKALLEKEFKYIGVLGSKKKMETLFADYRKQGIADDMLQRIHTPIGLAINSQTPEEIAVSIAAQIIKVKNGLATNSTNDTK